MTGFSYIPFENIKLFEQLNQKNNTKFRIAIRVNPRAYYDVKIKFSRPDRKLIGLNICKYF